MMSKFQIVKNSFEFFECEFEESFEILIFSNQKFKQKWTKVYF
jgi:hypothetical protein